MNRLGCREIPEGALVPAAHPIYALEKQASYPLGNDRFHIDHGRDYLAFFRRLGQVTYLTFDRDEELAGVVALVKRRLPAGDAHYLCDFKVAPRFRGTDVSREILAEVCRRFDSRLYGVSMNPPAGANPVLGLFARCLGTTDGPRLVLYSLSAEGFAAALPGLREHRGEISLRSLAGVKDIVLESTGRPMPLLHVQHGPCREAASVASRPDAIHMFCTPEGSALDRATRSAGLIPDASATVFHRGMERHDWSFILTSDI